MPMTDTPIVLDANQPTERFYAGGERISAFRGVAASAPNTPEDWIGSTTSVRGQAPTGMTLLPAGAPHDTEHGTSRGILLGDAIAADPLGWLGAEHVARWGSDAKLLVKLLDAGQRLAVHAHPDGAFAAAHLGAAHGKAEAWYLLSAGTVHVGLREDVDPAHLRALVDAQDTDALLALLNEIELQAGDTVWVPPGTLHAIGEGILLAEVQEPEDLSILLEWKGFDLDGTVLGHLDLGFDTALQAVTTTAVTGDELEALITRGVAAGSTLVAPADEYFRLDLVTAQTTPITLPAGLAIIIGVTDTLTLHTGDDELPVTTGKTVLVPAAAGAMRFTGHGSALVARPPQP
jgi:mannose-6-phosphate isomerase